jgi:hypothetical protein
MTPEAFQQVTGGLESVATILAGAAAGAWAYSRYRETREGVAHLQFEASIVPVGLHAGRLVANLTAKLANKGKVQQGISCADFTYELRVATGESPLTESEGELVLPPVLKAGRWLPATWKTTWIEPGVEECFTQGVILPEGAKFAALSASLIYERHIGIRESIRAALPIFGGTKRAPTASATIHTAKCLVNVEMLSSSLVQPVTSRVGAGT